MTTVKQSNGKGIKDAIGHDKIFPIPLNEVLFERDKNIDPEFLTPLQQEAIETIAAFKRRQDEIAYGGTLSEHVYYFLGGWEHPDTVREYTNIAVEMLVALTDNNFSGEVEAKIGSRNKEQLVKLLNQTFRFMEGLQAAGMRALLDIQEVANQDWEGREDRLQDTLDEYRDKLQVSYESKHIRF